MYRSDDLHGNLPAYRVLMGALGLPPPVTVTFSTADII